MLTKREFFDDTPPLQQADAQIEDIVREMNWRMDEMANLTGLKIAFQGDVLTDNSTPTVDGMRIVFAHHAEYKPLSLLYWYNEPEQVYRPLPFLVAVGDNPLDTNRRQILAVWGAAADNTNLYARIEGQMQTPSARFYYVVFDNPIGTVSS